MTFHPTLSERLAKPFPIRHDDRINRYLASYDFYLNYFKSRVAVSDLQLDDAKIGTILVYSWLQSKELRPDCWKEFALAKRMLQRDRAARLNAHEIDALKSFVGSSLAATSIYLHLFNAGRYAIWDANIARTAYRYTWRQSNRADVYLEYLDDIRDLKIESELREKLIGVMGSACTLRLKHFALLQLGLAESTSSSDSSSLDLTDFPYVSERFTLGLDP